MKPTSILVFTSFLFLTLSHVFLLFMEEDIIREKVQAYSKRLKIRDLYDIFFLLRYVEDRDKIRKELNNLTADFKKPLDEKDLKILLFEGLTPTVQQMIDYIGRL